MSGGRETSKATNLSHDVATAPALTLGNYLRVWPGAKRIEAFGVDARGDEQLIGHAITAWARGLNE